MRKVFSTVISIALICAGLVMFLYPNITEYLLQKQTDEYITEFEQEYYADSVSDSNDTESSEVEDENIPQTSTNSKENDPLYQEILEYNTEIYNSGQAEFKDAWSYVQSPIDISNLKNGKFGYIRIPAMKVRLPLYLGASDENMAKGAAVLGQTSIPIGGINTNSVIAGHRGWSTGAFFKRIERLEVGDHVFITNPWETLVYKVESIDITSPYASEKVKIQEGKDMITLVTCHPYLSHGEKYRYLVFCVRDTDYNWDDDESICEQEEEKGEEKYDSQKDDAVQITASDGQQYESSDSIIFDEEKIRFIGAAIIVIVLGLSLLKLLLRRK